MSRTIVEITWDQPAESHWLCPDNIAHALQKTCPNTKFQVKSFLSRVVIELTNGRGEIIEKAYHFEEGDFYEIRTSGGEIIKYRKDAVNNISTNMYDTENAL